MSKLFRCYLSIRLYLITFIFKTLCIDWWQCSSQVAKMPKKGQPFNCLNLEFDNNLIKLLFLQKFHLYIVDSFTISQINSICLVELSKSWTFLVNVLKFLCILLAKGHFGPIFLLNWLTHGLRFWVQGQTGTKITVVWPYGKIVHMASNCYFDWKIVVIFSKSSVLQKD